MRVGSYLLHKTIGMGGFSKVKLATHEPTGCKVAIKILSKQKLADIQFGSKFWMEIRVLSKFCHPNVNRLYEVLEDSVNIYVVVEYAPKGDLFEFVVARGRLPESEARRVFQQIILGVDYCHSQRVVHRDLKPENILMDADNNIKIADFGLSSILNDGLFLSTSCGSPNYAAPEVVSGKPYGGPEVDVWSCGVILYVLLMGRLPFDDENIPSLFRKIREGVYRISSNISAEARDLISRMICVPYLKRITIGQMKRHEWFVRDLEINLGINLEEDSSEPKSKYDEKSLQRVEEIHNVRRADILKALGYSPTILVNPKHPFVELRPLVVSYFLLSGIDMKMSRDMVFPQQDSEDQGELLPSVLFPGQGLRWMMGIGFIQDRWTVMTHLFKRLKALGAFWKCKTPYDIQVHSQTGLSILIKAYQIQEQGTLILDIHLRRGSQFEFFYFCSHLIPSS